MVGTVFADAISGFDCAAGYVYSVRYESFDDGTHHLIGVMSETQVDGVVGEIGVRPWRVQCQKNVPINAAYVVLNRQPFYGQIEYLPRVHGYEYRLRVESIDLMPSAEESPAATSKQGCRLLEI